jgi:hypothetical protein
MLNLLYSSGKLRLWGYSWHTGSMEWVFAWWRWLSDYYLCRTFVTYIRVDCASSECSSGRYIWDWCFSLASSVTKQIPASFSVPPFCLFLSPLPHPTSFSLLVLDSSYGLYHFSAPLPQAVFETNGRFAWNWIWTAWQWRLLQCCTS